MATGTSIAVETGACATGREQSTPDAVDTVTAHTGDAGHEAEALDELAARRRSGGPVTALVPPPSPWRGGRGKRMPDDVRAAILQELAAGASPTDLAHKWGCSTSTIWLLQKREPTSLSRPVGADMPPSVGERAIEELRALQAAAPSAVPVEATVEQILTPEVLARIRERVLALFDGTIRELVVREVLTRVPAPEPIPSCTSYPALNAVLARLPDVEAGWADAAARERWLRAFQAVLDLEVAGVPASEARQ